jgi:hypothetical protein
MKCMKDVPFLFYSIFFSPGNLLVFCSLTNGNEKNLAKPIYVVEIFHFPLQNPYTCFMEKSGGRSLIGR